MIDIEKIKEGDHVAFHKFYVFFYPKLKAFACRFVDEPTSNDLVQEVFTSFWEKKKEIQVENIQSYLYKWLQNKCLNYLRDKITEKEYETRFEIAQQRIVFLENTKDFNDVLKNVINNNLREVIDLSVDKLPPKCAQAFRLCYWEDMSHKEIAEIMKISHRTVEGYIRQSILFLRKELKDILILFFMFFNIN